MCWEAVFSEELTGIEKENTGETPETMKELSEARGDQLHCGDDVLQR